MRMEGLSCPITEVVIVDCSNGKDHLWEKTIPQAHGVDLHRSHNLDAALMTCRRQITRNLRTRMYKRITMNKMKVLVGNFLDYVTCPGGGRPGGQDEGIFKAVEDKLEWQLGKASWRPSASEPHFLRSQKDIDKASS